MSLKKIYESLAAAKPFITEQTMYLVWSKKTDNSVDGGPYWDLKSAANNMWSPDQFVMNMDTYEPVVSYEEYQSQVDESGINENAEELNIGDDVIITGPVQFHGKTGIIDSFGSGNRFVVVNLYNHGKHSFHSSDVSFNEYADSDEEESDRFGEEESWDDDIDEGIVDESSAAMLQAQINDLQQEYRREMVKQNNGSSVTRSYGSADRIKDQIRDLQNKLRNRKLGEGDNGWDAPEPRATDHGAEDRGYGMTRQKKIDDMSDEEWNAYMAAKGGKKKPVAEGDPDIPLDVHKAMKAKEREQFTRNMARDLASKKSERNRQQPQQRNEPQMSEASSDYSRRRQREEDIISGKKPARKKAPAQTSDYANRRAKEKANESVQNDNPMLAEIKRLAGLK